jgi:uncharacterized protein (TIGR00255 family)
MTGFGQATLSTADFSADVTVRTVNQKHLKTKVVFALNMPEVIDRVNALVREYLYRGTVDVIIRVDWEGAGDSAFNPRVIEGYVRELEKLRKKLGLEEEIRLDRVATLPGAMVFETADSRTSRQIWRRLKPVVVKALEKTVTMREREGRALARELRKIGRRMNTLVGRIEKRGTRAVEQYRKRLDKRVKRLVRDTGTQLDQGTMAREVILYGERSDISEELLRMKAHVDHFLETLGDDVVGRKLEFIAQEMHREANTMASKASDPQMTELIIDLRGEVDRVREQVFNLE